MVSIYSDTGGCQAELSTPREPCLTRGDGLVQRRVRENCDHLAISGVAFLEPASLLPVDRITHRDFAALEDPGEDSFFGHDAVADLMIDGTSRMALFADLGHFHKCPAADLETVTDLDRSEVKALRRDVFRKAARFDVQALAEASLKGKKGAIAAMDPRDGRILALASSPGAGCCLQNVLDPGHHACRVWM